MGQKFLMSFLKIYFLFIYSAFALFFLSNFYYRYSAVISSFEYGTVYF